ncbi:RES family NAD+ phosphorylase [Serratia fonticola]|uniref:RES family NAD+ phosphorylase n=1 Tax=Serratia fonticola TaxID=47917 RepID=UPI003985E9DE
MPIEKRICADCVSDDYLKDEIAASMVQDLECDYCHSVQPTIDMGHLAKRCDKVLEDFYEVSSLTDAVVFYDRDPQGEPLVDILDNLIGASERAPIEDLEKILSEMWFDFSSHEHIYGEDPWFIEKTKLAEPLNESWRKIERSLKHEARFINPEAARMLESVFGPVLDDRTYEGHSVIVEVSLQHEINTLYRARVFQTLTALEQALNHPEFHLGPPPSGMGAAGRMNAKGVSVFYGATEKMIALSEVRPPVGSHVVVASFKVIRTLRLLDLQKLGTIMLKPMSSPFNPITATEASRRDFLAALTKKMVMPVMPELEGEGYLITQVIADFLSTHSSLKLDGILFPSAQNTLSPSDESSRNVILFNKASIVIDAGASPRNKTEVSLWEYEDENSWFNPEITTITPESESSSARHSWELEKQIEPSLELDRDSLEVHKVCRVEIVTESHKVSHFKYSSQEDGRTTSNIPF